MRLNLKKPCLFLDDNNLRHSRELVVKFALLQGSLSVRYLGVPLMPYKLRPQDYISLIDKVLKHMSSWIAHHLSFAGILQLIQSVIMIIVKLWCSFCQTIV